MSNEMTPVIATRNMTRTLPNGDQKTITVEVGQPMETPAGSPHGGWYCTMRIIGIKQTPEVLSFGGHDSVGALTSALCAAGVILSALPYANEIDFSQAANFLFPVPPLRAALDRLNL